MGSRVLNPRKLDVPPKFDYLKYTKPIRVNTHARASKTVIGQYRECPPVTCGSPQSHECTCQMLSC
jgi:hypothetical protein